LTLLEHTLNYIAGKFVVDPEGHELRAVEMLTDLFISTSVLFAFIITYVATEWAIRKMKVRGIVVADVHKRNEAMVPGMGGVPVLIGYVAGILFLSIPFISLYTKLFSALTAILIVCLMGMIDDLLNLSQRTKAFLPLIASVPIIIVLSGDRTLLIPLIGELHVGVLYPLFLVPVGVAAASNLTNLLAGLNGLEAGMGAIAMFSVLIAALIMGNTVGALAVAPMVGALAAFLLFNKYPAKILPGNSMTYAIGVVVASAVILGDMEVIGVICLFPYVVEFLIKARTLFRGSCFGKVNSDGTLSPRSTVESLTHVVMKMGRYTERQVVMRLWLIEAIFGIVAILVAYTSLYYQLLR